MKINNNINKTLISILFSIIGTISIPYIVRYDNILSYTNDIVSIIIFVSLYYLFHKTISHKNIKSLKTTYLIGVMFSLFLVLGVQIDKTGEIELSGGTCISILSMSLIISCILTNFYNFLDKIKVNKENEIINKKKYKSPQKNAKFFFCNMQKSDKTKFIIIVCLVIFLCWVPVFLAVYPGYFCHDAFTQFRQVDSGNLNSHHPVLHTLLLGVTVKMVYNITNSWNTGIAVYTILQMLVISACLSYCIYFLNKHKVSKKIQIATLIYYAFFPVVVMFGMCSTKDSLFTAITLVTVLFIIDMILDKKEFFSNSVQVLKFILAIFLMFAFRNNAIYAFILFIPILIYICKGYRRKMLLIIVSIFILWGTYTGPIHNILNVKKSSNIEMLSVPLQQVARVYNYNYDSLTEKQVETMYEVISEENLKRYEPKLSDPIKGACKVNILQKDYMKYFKLWAEIGIKNPKIYVESFLENTLGYWYPNTIIDGYCIGWNYESETTFFKAATEKPGERDSKNPLLEKIYYEISRGTTMQKIPVISMLFSVGFVFWVLIICLGYNIYKKRNAIIVPLLLILFQWFTVVFGPIVLPRYVLILFFAFPLFITFLFNGNRFEKNVSKEES